MSKKIALTVILLVLVGVAVVLCCRGYSDKKQKIFSVDDLNVNQVYSIEGSMKSDSGELFVYIVPCELKRGSMSPLKDKNEAFFMQVFEDEQMIPLRGFIYAHEVPGLKSKKVLTWPNSELFEKEEVTVQE